MNNRQPPNQQHQGNGLYSASGIPTLNQPGEEQQQTFQNQAHQQMPPSFQSSQQHQHQHQQHQQHQGAPLFNQEINWNSNYRQSQDMSMTPRMGSITQEPQQQQQQQQQFPPQLHYQPSHLSSSSSSSLSLGAQTSPYGSPTNQFRNPWYPPPQSAPNSTSMPQSTSTSSSAGNNTALFSTPTRSTFNQLLPTTYEYDITTNSDNSQASSRKNSFVLPMPPSRAPAPGPAQQQILQQQQQQQQLQQQQQQGYYYSNNEPSLMGGYVHNSGNQQMNMLGPYGNLNINSMAELQRRQSIAYQPNAPPSQQQANNGKMPFMNYPGANGARRQSFLQYSSNLKALPVPVMRKVNNKTELKPNLNKVPKYRRASMGSNYISPLNALTMDLTTTFTLCQPDFHYEISKNPKRVLTKPSEGKLNNGYDNEDNDYILYVNDVLGVEENKKYMVLDILGHGTFAQVVKCQNLKTKELVAVKIVKGKNSYINQSLSEISLLELINKKIDPNDEHNFLRMKDKFVHKNHLCLVFELLSSNLFELIKQNEFKGLSLKLVRTFTKQLLHSLSILKDSKIIHCDLKPENILLMSPDKPQIKIVDFGSACQERQTLYTYIQSRFYRSPEVILGLPYTSAIDTWSLGCIIAELFLGLPLFPGNSEYDQLMKITNILGPPPNWMVEMGKTAKNFLTKDHPEDAHYRMKSLAQYNEDRGLHEEPGKVYFNTDNLDDLILKYTMNKKAMTSTMIENEMKERRKLIHLIRGLLTLNPLERWSPQQASMHPFVTGVGEIEGWGERFGGGSAAASNTATPATAKTGTTGRSREV